MTGVIDSLLERNMNVTGCKGRPLESEGGERMQYAASVSGVKTLERIIEQCIS
jgi:hypothetical protein